MTMNKEEEKKRKILSQLKERLNDDSEAEYRNILSIHEKIERTEIIASKLKDRYSSYENTCLFVDYLRATYEIFARAENEKWSAEKTKIEMIEGEIYLMSLQSGVDEKIFKEIYNEFKDMSVSAERVQVIAKKLTEKYKDRHDKFVREFIIYIRDYLLIFSKDWEIEGSLTDIKEKIIRARMRVLTETCSPNSRILENIYEEFLFLFKRVDVDLTKI